jgi:hypothetical protein
MVLGFIQAKGLSVLVRNLHLALVFLISILKEPSMAESNGRDWRDLCAAAAKEPDSEKLVSLVNEILKAFDDRPEGLLSSDPIEGCS